MFKTLPRAVWALCLGAFVNRFGSFVVPFLTLYLTRGGYPATQAGAVVSVYGIGSLGAAALGGYLADHLGRRATIALSMFASAAAMLLLSQAGSLALIALLTGFAGLTSELYRPATGALIADLIPPERRVTGFALYRLAINLGVAVGTAAAGFLADRSFALLFLGDAATSILFGLIALAALPTKAPSHLLAAAPLSGDSETEAPAGHSSQRLFGALTADWRFALFLLASTLSSLVYFQSLSTLGLQVRALGLPNAAYGALLALNGALILVLELPLTTFTRRQPPSVVMAAGFLLIGLGFGGVALARSLPPLGITVLLWTFGEMLYAPVAAAYVANSAPIRLRGRYQGVWGLAAGLGLIFAPALGTRLFVWNPLWLWLLCSVIGMMSAVCVFIAARDSRPPAQPDPR